MPVVYPPSRLQGQWEQGRFHAQRGSPKLAGVRGFRSLSEPLSAPVVSLG